MYTFEERLTSATRRLQTVGISFVGLVLAVIVVADKGAKPLFLDGCHFRRSACVAVDVRQTARDDQRYQLHLH